MNSRFDFFTHYEISDGLVRRPKTNSMYHIPYQTYDVTMTFFGKHVEDYSFYDFTAGYGWIWKSRKWSRTQTDYVSKESLPPSYRAISLPPIMQIVPGDSLKKISTVNKIEVSCNDSNLTMNSWAADPSIYLKAYNQEIQENYQKLVKVPVMAGEYPIFLDENKTNAKKLKKIYRKFIASNPDEKLNLQYQATSDDCHIRAKVVIDYLRDVHEVNVLRIYKIWDKEDWKPFGENDGWTFHCAALPVTGPENTPWVWDPWVGLNKKLLTIPEWVYRGDEPTPKKIIITNQAIIHDWIVGKRIEAPHFFENMCRDTVKSYETVAASAFPEYPLAANGFSFIKAKSALKDQKKEYIIENPGTHKRKMTD